MKEKINTNTINVLVLAYMGDAIYENYVREYLILEKMNNVDKLQKKSIDFVSANSQYRILMNMLKEEFLNEKEIEMVKKGRNAKSKSVPKKVSVKVYNYATGLEVLIGWLYFKEEFKRLEEIFEFIFKEEIC